MSETMFEYLRGITPRPADMKQDAYERTLRARAFDVARYLLFWGVPTNVGQVTSIRTLEKQIRRLKGSEYAELRSLGEEIAQARTSVEEASQQKAGDGGAGEHRADAQRSDGAVPW